MCYHSPGLRRNPIGACPHRIAYYAEKLDALAADGKIDDAERDRITNVLEPLVDAAKEMVFA